MEVLMIIISLQWNHKFTHILHSHFILVPETLNSMNEAHKNNILNKIILGWGNTTVKYLKNKVIINIASDTVRYYLSSSHFSTSILTVPSSWNVLPRNA